jgi:septal ring factor EnvC (AmiA/AmiB activator)
VWTASSLNTSYDNRITNLEEDLSEAVERIEETETAQTRILTDLAEIKTDIAWIRRQLERSE